MYKLYLVCTRAAISGSSLAYIINQSPDFYSVPHNNVWEEEACDMFGTAYTINDWWNINDHMRLKLHYNADFRNTQNLTQQQLLDLANGFNELNLGKNICLFAHARNISELKGYITKHNLPIVLVSTVMGDKCGQFVNTWIKREYSNEMNKYIDLFDAWEYLYTQRISNDPLWAKHADYVFSMHEWLIEPEKIYNKLGIGSCTNISKWSQYYLSKNNNPIEEYVDTCKKLSTLLHLYDSLQNNYPEHYEKITLCHNLFEMIHTYTDSSINELQQLYADNYPKYDD